MARLYRRGKIYWIRAQRNNREIRQTLKTSDRKIAERRFKVWLNEIDATLWGEKPHRSYAAAEEKFINEHLTVIKPLAESRPPR